MNILQQFIMERRFVRQKQREREALEQERDQLFDAILNNFEKGDLGGFGTAHSITIGLVNGGINAAEVAALMEHITKKHGGVSKFPVWGTINRSSLIEIRANAIAYGVRLRDDYVSPSGKVVGKPLTKTEIDRATRRAMQIRKSSAAARASFALNERRTSAKKPLAAVMTPWQVRGYIKRSTKTPTP